MTQSRRDIFKALGAAGAAALLARDARAQDAPGYGAPVSPIPQPPGSTPETNAEPPRQTPPPLTRQYNFLNADEAAFVEAAIARLIPAEPEWAGALEADVSVYIDRQLSGAYGQGAKFYRNGPFAASTPTQGYQLQHTPAELFRLGARLLNEKLQAPRFSDRTVDEQDRLLAALEKGEIIESKPVAVAFFQLLLGLTMEGYFADPLYGGNRDMVSWRMLGFPGAQAGWANIVEDHGVALCLTPVSAAGAMQHHDNADQKKG